MFHENLSISLILSTRDAENVSDFPRKNEFFEKIKISAVRAGIMFMQIKYNDPGSNLSLQTFVHKNIHFYFFVVMIFDDFSRFPDSFWWISMDLSTN